MAFIVKPTVPEVRGGRLMELVMITGDAWYVVG